MNKNEAREGMIAELQRMRKLQEMKESLAWTKNNISNKNIKDNTSPKTDGSVKTTIIIEDIKENLASLSLSLLKVLDIDGDNKLTQTDFKAFGKTWSFLMGVISAAYLSFLGLNPAEASLSDINGYLFIIFAIIAGILVLIYLLIAAKFNKSKAEANKLKTFSIDLMNKLAESKQEVTILKEDKMLTNMRNEFCMNIQSGLNAYEGKINEITFGGLLLLAENKKTKLPDIVDKKIE